MNDKKAPVAGPDDLPQSEIEAPVTLDGLMAEIQAELGREMPQTAGVAGDASPEIADDDYLSEGDYEWLTSQLEVAGPNPEIEEMLRQDRMKGGQVKRRRDALRLRGPALVPSDRTLPSKAESAAATESPVAPTRPVSRISLPDPSALANAIRTVTPRDTRQLLVELAALTRAVHAKARVRKSVDEVRKWIWAMNAVLTERGVPPCVRPHAKLGEAFRDRKLISPEQKLIANDRQIFHLDYVRREGWGKPEAKWERLVRDDELDLETAAQFVATVGNYEKKCKALGLREDEQVQLGAIRSPAITKRWERLIADADRLEDVLRGAGGIGGSKVKAADVPRWREEFVVLKLAQGSPAQASRLLSRFYGRSKAANQLANRKAHLRDKGFPVE